MAKNKQKSRKVAVKRFKITKTGKVKRKASATTHLARKNDASNKSSKKVEVQMKGKFARKLKSFIVKSK